MANLNPTCTHPTAATLAQKSNSDENPFPRRILCEIFLNGDKTLSKLITSMSCFPEVTLR